MKGIHSKCGLGFQTNKNEKRSRKARWAAFTLAFWLQTQQRGQALHSLPHCGALSSLKLWVTINPLLLLSATLFQQKESNEDAQVQWWLNPDLGLLCSLALLLTVYEALDRWLSSVCLSFLIYEMEKLPASPSQGFVIIDRISDIYQKDWLLWHRKPDVFLCRSLSFSEGKSLGVWSVGRGALTLRMMPPHIRTSLKAY